jgi:hypothetical protein
MKAPYLRLADEVKVVIITVPGNNDQALLPCLVPVDQNKLMQEIS